MLAAVAARESGIAVGVEIITKDLRKGGSHFIFVGRHERRSACWVRREAAQFRHQGTHLVSAHHGRRAEARVLRDREGLETITRGGRAIPQPAAGPKRKGLRSGSRRSA